MRVIGTAGHVDHGKSTLIEALTGTHPDRLKEEREREMTIDLGFAWLVLPNGEEVGIVDVPGHRDFIENMLAGIGGIDAALFVVAADEGVMPQTREHLAILDLLQIQGGVVALTKTDLIDDEEWLDLVEADLRLVLANTVLEDAPIVRVSARTGRGVQELLAKLQENLAERPPRPDLKRPRLPVDRVFTVAGFGSVVTGTLTDGQLHLGDEVEILPHGLRGRVRGLQTHKRKEEAAVQGSRTAVNISGVAVEDLQRGQVITRPGSYRPTGRMDVRFRLLPDANLPLKHNTEVKLYLGASEVVARVRLLGSEELQPGEEGWLQLEVGEPVVAVRGDRYILRRPSPGETLGGGVVVDPHPKGRHKRFSEETLDRLSALSEGTPGEVLLQAITALGAASLKDAIARANLETTSANAAVNELVSEHRLVDLDAAGEGVDIPPDHLVVRSEFWEGLAERATHEVAAYHKTFPLKPGMPREELKSRLKNTLKASPRLFNLTLRRLVDAGRLKESGPLVLIPGHTIQFSPVEKRSIDELMKRFSATPYTPPSLKECQAGAGEEVVNALIEIGRLIAVGPEVVFRTEDYERMVNELRELFARQATLSAAEVRDHFNTSRKYALALLEHLDAQGITVREGDVRRLKK